ncbi:4268_t:CDS:10 [Paraglomus brasilianum]|uniref:phosphatidate phosphatase n=1 Tax=Paraglomus brasilianum TaxID=144538 RepID=A0A9N9AII8_9GLOM|nr:4268_t:CDS:10 [Paraglomus brasilianum]
MHKVYEFMSSVNQFYREINPSTLSGAIDVIVVEQPDGKLACSPFHVRFGKLCVLRPQEKRVEVAVNDVIVDFPMKVGEAGEAFFIFETEKDVPEELQTSPLAGPSLPAPNAEEPDDFDLSASPNDSNSAKESDAKVYESFLPTIESDDHSQGTLVNDIHSAGSVQYPQPSAYTSSTTLPAFSIDTTATQLPLEVATPTIAEISDVTEIESGLDGSDSEVMTENTSSMNNEELIMHVDRLETGMAMKECTEEPNFLESKFRETAHLEAQMNLMMANQDPTTMTDKPRSIREWSPLMSPSSEAQNWNEPEGPFSDTECSRKPDNQLERHAIRTSPLSDTELEYSSIVPSPSASQEWSWGWGALPVRNSDKIKDSESNPNGSHWEEDDEHDGIIEIGGRKYEIGISLCGSKEFGVNQKTDAELFRKNQISYENFCENPHVLNDKALVVRYNDRYYTWTTASPLLVSLLAFQKPLPDSVLASLASSQRSEGHRLSNSHRRYSLRGLSRWWSRGSGKDGSGVRKMENMGEIDEDKMNQIQRTEKLSKNYAKTLRLTSDQLKSLNLKKGMNTVSFSVTSSYQGRATCYAKICFWDYDTHIVISDIDGTITKSDALGHLYAMIGRDWTHSGVAKLYTDIHNNGYEILYLTSRAIGQADYTRDYLKKVEQNKYQLPEGPVIMSPDRLLTAFHREVIMRKPELFKMACLRDVQQLFGNRNPFVAGFGNRITDALSYRSVNVPSSRIFTIDSTGTVAMELLSGYKSSYIDLSDLVDQMFPHIGSNKWDTEYNDWQYWKAPLPKIDLPPEFELSTQSTTPASPQSDANASPRLGVIRSIAGSITRSSSRSPSAIPNGNESKEKREKEGRKAGRNYNSVYVGNDVDMPGRLNLVTADGMVEEEEENVDESETHTGKYKSSVVATPCGHVFHTSCIHQWLNIKPECPLCGAKATGKSLLSLYHDWDEHERKESRYDEKMKEQISSLSHSLLIKTQETKILDEIVTILKFQISQYKAALPSKTKLDEYTQEIKADMIALKQEYDGRAMELRNKCEKLKSEKRSLKGKENETVVSKNSMTKLENSITVNDEGMYRFDMSANNGRNTVEEISSKEDHIRKIDFEMIDVKLTAARYKTEDTKDERKVCENRDQVMDLRTSVNTLDTRNNKNPCSSKVNRNVNGDNDDVGNDIENTRDNIRYNTGNNSRASNRGSRESGYDYQGGRGFYRRGRGRGFTTSVFVGPAENLNSLAFLIIARNINSSNSSNTNKKKTMPSLGVKIYVGNLPERARPEDIRECFAKYGNVVNMELKGNYGFIEYEERRSCDDAISHLHGNDFQGQQLRVEYAHAERNDEYKSRDTKSTDACFKCGQVGHWARDCTSYPPRDSYPARDTYPPRDDRYAPPPLDRPYERSAYDRYPREPREPRETRDARDQRDSRDGRDQRDDGSDYRRDYRGPYDRGYDRERGYERGGYPDRDYDRYAREGYDRGYYPVRDAYDRDGYDRRPLPPPDAPPYSRRNASPGPRRGSYERGPRPSRRENRFAREPPVPSTYRSGRSSPPSRYPEPLMGPPPPRPPSPRGGIYNRRRSVSPIRGNRVNMGYTGRPRSPSPMRIQPRRGPRTPTSPTRR